ncbi:MAG TPA: methyltransferase [Myxococcales bacterium]|nr:methyltransferase [Myxococcales bacterium]
MKRARRRGPAPLPAPSAAARKALGPYARGRLVEAAPGFPTLSLDVPWDVFSSQRIDEGTLLLLRHLPEGEPASFLDLGCGYGALGLPVAARWPKARALLIDRDLLAVAASAHNATALRLGNVEVRPGLGYRGLAGRRFDWILCNVPARIGPRAIRYLLEGGRALGAEVRAVVIRDLAGLVRSLGLPGLSQVASGPRHEVFSLSPAPAQVDLDDDDVYARDQTAFEGLRLSRPHDASEDPEHGVLLGALAESLPQKGPSRALAFRAGYGVVPLLIKSRYASAEVVAQERDLLDAAFLRRNARALGHSVEVRETLFPADGLAPGGFPLVVGELSSPAGPAVARRELQDAADLLAPGGEALIVATARQEREWLAAAAPKGFPHAILLRRRGASVLRISRPKAL